MIWMMGTLFIILTIFIIIIFIGVNRQPQYQLQGFATMKFYYESEEDIILIEETENNNLILHCYRTNKKPKDAISDEYEIGYCNVYCLDNEAIYWERLEEEDQWDNF